MKVRKGDIVAFRTRRGSSAFWRIGLVNSATRNGKVKSVLSNGSVIKTLSLAEIVEKVLYIPRDQVREGDLLFQADGQEWATLEECENFVAPFVLSPSP